MLIDSTGGSVFPTMDLIRVMKQAQYRGAKFHCIVTRYSMSAAFYIYSMCNTRYAVKYSRHLYHDGRLNVYMGSFDEDSLTANGINMKFLNNKINKDIRKALKLSKKKYDNHKEVMWFPSDLKAASPKFLTIVDDYKVRTK